MTTATMTAGGSVRRNPGFFAQLNAEWTKLRSVRSFYIEMVLAIGLSIGMTALIALAIGSSYDQFSEQERETFDPVFTSFFGTIFGLITLIVLGVTFSASEYTSGMIRLTMAATPQRGRVLAAKGVLVLVVTLAAGLVMSFGCFFAGQAVLAAYDVPTASLSDNEALRAVIATWLMTPLWPLLGTAVGFILRSTASAITSTMVLLFAPAIFGGLLPDWWQKNFIAYLPSNAGDSLMVTNRDPDMLTYLEPALAVVVLLAWFAVFFGTAYVLLRRRDV
ncbi:MAG: ABC transporter permease subunit [Dehalococcoidia bacterium]